MRERERERERERDANNGAKAEQMRTFFFFFFLSFLRSPERSPEPEDFPSSETLLSLKAVRYSATHPGVALLSRSFIHASASPYSEAFLTITSSSVPVSRSLSFARKTEPDGARKMDVREDSSPDRSTPV